MFAAAGRTRNILYIHPFSNLQMRQKSRCTPGLRAPCFPATVFLLFIIFTVHCACAVDEIESSKGLEFLERCKDDETTQNVTSTVMSGLPFSLDCDMQLNRYYYDISLEDDNEVKCVVTLNDEIVVHESNLSDAIMFPDISDEASPEPFILENTTISYDGSIFSTYLIDKENCFKVSYYLRVIQNAFPQSCSNATFEEESTSIKEIEYGRNDTLECLGKKSSFHFTSGIVTWYKDCSKIHQDDFASPIDIGQYVVVSRLEIGSDPTVSGEYTCSVTFNDQEIFLSKISVCVKHRQYEGPPAFSAITPTRVRAHMGDDITLGCSGILGSSLGLSFATSWNKQTDGDNLTNICGFYTSDSLNGRRIKGEKYQCSLKSNIMEATRCYSDPELFNQDESDGVTRANSTLIIRNFKPSDAGNYSCRVMSTHHAEIVYFTVEMDERGKDILLILLPVLAGVLLLLLFLLVLFICIRRGKIKKQWKRTLGRTSSLKDSSKSDGSNSSEPGNITHNSDMKQLPREIV